MPFINHLFFAILMNSNVEFFNGISVINNLVFESPSSIISLLINSSLPIFIYPVNLSSPKVLISNEVASSLIITL